MIKHLCKAPIQCDDSSGLTGSSYVGYAAFVNLMDYPSVVIPATKVDPEIDEPKLSARGAWNPDDEQNYAAYDPVVMKGMPVGLQFVGRRLHEENLLACAKIVEKALSA